MNAMLLKCHQGKGKEEGCTGQPFLVSGRAGAGQRKKSVGPGGVTVKLGHFWGGAGQS